MTFWPTQREEVRDHHWWWRVPKRPTPHMPCHTPNLRTSWYTWGILFMLVVNSSIIGGWYAYQPTRERKPREDWGKGAEMVHWKRGEFKDHLLPRGVKGWIEGLDVKKNYFLMCCKHQVPYDGVVAFTGCEKTVHKGSCGYSRINGTLNHAKHGPYVCHVALWFPPVMEKRLRCIRLTDHFREVKYIQENADLKAVDLPHDWTRLFGTGNAQSEIDPGCQTEFCFIP